MSDLNQCTFTGRLGRDPETRTFPSGDMVCNASIAVSETWKDKQTGERQERTEWVSLTFSGKLADVASQYLRKGSQVAVSGKLRTRKWQDRETGQDRYATEIMVNHMTMIGGKQDGPAPAPAPRQQRAAPAPAAQGGFEDMDDDIPFIDPMKRRAFAMAI